MISSSVRNQGVWKSKHKEKFFGNQLEFDRNEEQNKDPKSLFFFDFSNP